jgi:hypothetical protein
MLSFLEMPKGVRNRLDYYISHFFSSKVMPTKEKEEKVQTF